jgi:hypothetical protein
VGRLVKSLGDKLLLAFLIILFAYSVVAAIYQTVTKNQVPSAFTAPVVLAGLYAVVKLVADLPEIHEDVRYLRRAADVHVDRMATVKDFHDSLLKALEKATSTLDLTHIRDNPPADFGPEASKFYEQLVDWVTVDGRSIRRIIAVKSPAMCDWARNLADDTKHLSNFRIRVIDWKPNVPAINLAIVDGRAVYLALTGEVVERTAGIGIEDDTATQYFSDYYNTLWHGSVDLKDWLAADSREGRP